MKALSVIMFGPLFSLAERRFNVELAKAINIVSGNYLNIILPQNEAEAFKVDDSYDFEALYLHNLANAENYQLAIAILDGSDADSGTCLEIGHRKGRDDHNIVVGVRTDFRGSEDGKINAMLRRCDVVVEYFGDDLEELAHIIVNAIFKIIADQFDYIYYPLDSLSNFTYFEFIRSMVEQYNKKRPHLS